MIPAIVLAAGRSSRMGRPKATLPLGEHETFLSRIVATMFEAGVEDVVVVVGHHAREIAESFAASGLGARFVVNRSYDRGQLSSIVAGLSVVDRPGVAAALVTRLGVKTVLIIGMSFLTLGLLYFTQVSVGGSYWADLFPGFLLLGVAIPFAFVPITIAALAGTKPQEAGLASGLINTSQQIGGAVGIAILSTIAVNTTENALADRTPLPVALTDGFVNAFWAGAAIAAAGLLVAIFLVRGRDLQPQEEQVAEPALEGVAQSPR